MALRNGMSTSCIYRAAKYTHLEPPSAVGRMRLIPRTLVQRPFSHVVALLSVDDEGSRESFTVLMCPLHWLLGLQRVYLSTMCHQPSRCVEDSRAELADMTSLRPSTEDLRQRLFHRYRR